MPGEREAVRRRMAAAVQELWGTDELRAVSTTVLDEVTAGLIYFTSTLAEVVPAIYRDLDAAVRESYPDDDVVVPPLLTFGSWMGGDRDGNPFVTPEMTASALGLMKTACLTHLEGALTALAGRVTLSERVAGEPDGAAHAARAAPRRAPTRRSSRSCTSATPRSPTGASSSCSPSASARRARAPTNGYHRAEELVVDLRVAETALRRQRAGFVAADELRDVIRQVEVFGFHFARLDVREHADIHRRAIDEILSTLGVQDGYAEMSQDERIAVLAREIADRRPLIPVDVSGFSASAREVVETFRTMRDLLAGDHAGALGAYIVSRHRRAPRTCSRCCC